MKRAVLTLLLILLVPLAACTRYNVVPEQLEGRVDRDLRYEQVKESPSTYVGKMILVGGEILSAERLKDGTRIEVLQIPLTEDLFPKPQRAESKGRFIAYDHNGKVLDPAVLQSGTPITMVGAITGTETIKVGEAEISVPSLEIKHLTVWESERVRPYVGYYPPYYWGYRPYYGYAYGPY
ncbi:MAG: hypothetical protein C4293_07275 [Nitrospiraceae bacterium]